jgi:hypothetical protein
VIGIGALAAAGIYAAYYTGVPELNPTAPVAGTESIDPYSVELVHRQSHVDSGDVDGFSGAGSVH